MTLLLVSLSVAYNGFPEVTFSKGRHCHQDLKESGCQENVLAGRPSGWVGFDRQRMY